MKSSYEQIVDEVVQLKVKAVDEFVKETIEKIGDIGSPEKLIGKKYEDMTPFDKQLLTKIYGQGESTWTKLIARKEIDKLYELEEEVK